MRVTGKVKAAIDAMVWEGLPRDLAAVKAGLAPHSLYCALRKRHVLNAYNSECETLRSSGRARRIHRLEELSEQNSNLQAAVNANRALENMGDDPAATAVPAQRPGMLIVITQAPQALPEQLEQPAPRVINLTANSEDDDAE